MEPLGIDVLVETVDDADVTVVDLIEADVTVTDLPEGPFELLVEQWTGAGWL